MRKIVIIETVPCEYDDYYQVFIFNEYGNCLKQYGDHHDEGAEKAEGFCDGLSHYEGVDPCNVQLVVGDGNYCLSPREVWKLHKAEVASVKGSGF